MLRVWIIVLVFVLGCGVVGVSELYGKRGVPAEVGSVVWDGLTIRVSRAVEKSELKGQMGVVEAWDMKTNRRMWWRQIYAVKYRPGLEKDVQDVFINHMKVMKVPAGDGVKAAQAYLFVTNERKESYLLNLQTLDVNKVVIKDKKVGVE